MFPSNGFLAATPEIIQDAIIFDDSRLPLEAGYFYRSARYLFLRPPCLDDIQQDNVNDCFLLSVLQTLILRSPDYIYHLLAVDRHIDYVYVKLYHLDTGFVWIRVQKTIPKWWYIKQEPNAVWVQMIEKAYAALCIHIGRTREKTFYKMLSGGVSPEAFQALFGTLSESYSIVSERFIKRPLPAIVNNRSLYSHQFYSDLYFILEKPNLSGMTPQQIAALNGIFPDIHQRENFILASRADDFARNILIRRLFFLNFGRGIYYYKVLRQEDLLQAFEQHYLGVLHPATYQTLVDHVRMFCPSKRAIIGADNPNQKAHYDLIFNSLNEGKMVCVATDPVHTGFWCRGQSEDEQQIKGLAAGHAYAVLACFSKGERRFILLSNPWLEPYVREYHAHPSKVEILKAQALEVDRQVNMSGIPGPYQAVATGWNSRGHTQAQILTEIERLLRLKNTFPIELSDLTKRFSLIYTGQFPAALEITV